MKSVELSGYEIERFNRITGNLRHEKPHRYEAARIRDDGIVLILYDSKKLVYNTDNKTVDLVSLITAKPPCGIKNTGEKNDRTITENNTITENYRYIIGSDETGKGEWFGPLVVCAVCISQTQEKQLRQIGVKDSKKLTHKKITQLYRKIMELKIKHEIIILKPFSYNKLYAKFRKQNKNLNHLLSYLHTKCIKKLLDNTSTTDILVIIDKFDQKKMNRYLDINSEIKVIQESGAEKYTPVAASSIIAKYHYEKTLKQIEKKYNINTKTVKIEDISKENLDKITKTHFKNIQKHNTK